MVPHCTVLPAAFWWYSCYGYLCCCKPAQLGFSIHTDLWIVLVYDSVSSFLLNVSSSLPLPLPTQSVCSWYPQLRSCSRVWNLLIPAVLKRLCWFLCPRLWDPCSLHKLHQSFQTALALAAFVAVIFLFQVKQERTWEFPRRFQFVWP